MLLHYKHVMVPRFMKYKTFGSHAVRVVDFAITNNRENCKEFVQVGGLKAIFPVFMGRALAIRSLTKTDEREKLEEQVTLDVYA
jgi:hypothetical protein